MDIDTNSPFDQLLGLSLQEAGPARVVASLDVGEKHHQPFGLVHGGVFCTIVETLASIGANAWSMEHGHGPAVGVANSTDMLKSHKFGLLRAEAHPIHQGRSQQLWQVEIKRANDDVLVARGQLRVQNLGAPKS
jgi:uncharacterized protein (TIGR00369 family)